MRSVLRPESVALLRTVKPSAPIFSNMIATELFEAEHTRGRFKIIPHMLGGYVVFDTAARLNEGASRRFENLDEAVEALKRAPR